MHTDFQPVSKSVTLDEFIQFFLQVKANNSLKPMLRRVLPPGEWNTVAVFAPFPNRKESGIIQNKLEIWGKAQRESAWRPKSDWGKLERGGKISPASKSRGPNSNALVYTERALSTQGRST